MSIASEEQITNLQRLATIARRCGLSKKQGARSEQIVSKTTRRLRAAPNTSALRYGSGSLSAGFPPWNGR